MKKLLVLLITIIFVFTSSVIKVEGSAVPYHFEFSSLDDFLNAYLTAKEGGCIREFIERGWWTPGEDPAKSVEFTDFKTLYLPTDTPKGFVIDYIWIGEWSIYFKYIPKNDEIKSNTSIGFTIHREYSLDRHKVAFPNRLIYLNDDKYSLLDTSSVSFYWESDGILLSLGIDLRQQDTEEFKALFGDCDPLEFVKFAETRTVDLTDTAAVLDLINFGERFLRGDVNGDMRVDTADALMILRYSVGLIDEIDYDAADMNRDGVVNTADALRILRIAVGIGAEA